MPIEVPVKQTGLEASIDAAAKRAGRSLSINMGKSAKSIDMLSQPLGRITGKADEFTKSMEAANARVLAFGASVGVLTTITKAFKDLVTTTIQVEKQLASINTILNKDAAGLTKFKKEIFDVARNTEQSFDTVATAALELSRQGLGAEEVLNRLNDSMILSRLSGLGAAESVSGLTAAINSFAKSGITGSEILNKLSSAAASAAVSERDLIEAIKRSASVANQAGVSFDELVGVVTAVQQKTARGGAVIGNSFKTIFTRLQSFENLQTLQNLGVQITDFEGKVLPATKLIENLSGALAALPDQQAQDIATGLVGRFQVSPFLAILDDYNSKTQIAIDITKVAAGATNEAYMRNVALNQTLSAAINEATINLQELADTLGKIGVTDGLQNILTFFNSFVENIQNVLEGEGVGGDFARGIIKGIGNVLSGPGIAIFAAIIGKLTLDLTKFGVASLRTFFGMSQASKDIAATQGAIASTLLSNSNIQKQILAIENSTLSTEQKRLAQTKFFTTALNEQMAIMQRMQTIAGRVAPGVVAGTRGGGRGRAGGYIPNFAGGFGAEMRDIAAGVGGAPSTAKAVTIPNFNFGGGMVGPVVANDSEFLVPNFGGGGGSAIFNQNMVASMGLPAGARKINASNGLLTGRGTSKGVIRDERFAMVVPQQIGTKQATGRFGNKTYGFNVFGYNSGQLKARNDTQLKGDVSKFGIKLANEEAMTLTGGTPKAGKISKLANAGAIGGLAGAIFETALSALTKQSPEFDSKQTQTFDFFGPEIAGLRKLYPNIPSSVFFAEAKIRTGTDLNNSMASKMAKFGAGAPAGTLSKAATKEFIGSSKAPGLFVGAGGKKGLQKATGQKFASMAGGYIPNFANGSEPKFTTPRGRQINLSQALHGFGGKAIQQDAQKHMAAQVASSKQVTDANNKQASAMMSGIGVLGGLSIATSFLTGATQDATSSFGKAANTVAKSVGNFAMIGFAGQAFESLGKEGGAVRKFGQGLSKLTMITGGVVGGFTLFKGLFNEFSGANKIAADNLGILAGVTKEASEMLAMFSEEQRIILANEARSAMQRENTAMFFSEFRGKERDLVFQTKSDKEAIQKASEAALASGVDVREVNLVRDMISKGAITPLSTGGRGREGFFTGLTGLFGGDVVPSDVSQKALTLLRGLGKTGRGEFETAREAFRSGTSKEDLRSFGLGDAGKSDLFANFLMGQGFSRNFAGAANEAERKFQSRGAKEFQEAMKTVQMKIAGAQLKGTVENLRARQSQIKAEEKLIELQGIQGILTKDQLANAKSRLKVAEFQDKVTMTTLEHITEIASQAKVFGVSEEKLSEVLADIGEISFEVVKTEQDRESLMAKVVSKLGIENGLLEKNLKAENILLANSIKKLETEKNREIALINQTRELEKQVSVSTLLQKEAREIQNTIEGGTLQRDKVRKATLFGRLSAGISLSAATKRMDALDAIKEGTGSIEDVRRIDLAETLAKNLVSASQTFSQNIGDALVDAISKGESLGDTLKNAAADFFNRMSKALMNNAINNALNMGGSFFGFNTGGQVRGGSGVKDDVPALLTGGEFVMSKKAVQNYGAGFMGALNSGAVPKYADGGLFTPGTYGQGAIKGSSNLLRFATQSYTGGMQDQFLAGAGVAGLALEPQSGRLTMFGRRNSPAFQREQDSKRKAFSLFSQQYSKNAADRERKSQSGSQLLGSILGFGLSLGASSLFGGGLSNIFSKGKATGGAIPYSAGIDSVPAMLSGGEFVMNAAATQRLGAGNLAALNSGGGVASGGNSQIVGKLDQLNETIASSNTEINITVNSNGTENTDSPNAPEQQRNLATRIKDVVRQVIEDEKRLGGSLRMA